MFPIVFHSSPSRFQHQRLARPFLIVRKAVQTVDQSLNELPHRSIAFQAIIQCRGRNGLLINQRETCEVLATGVFDTLKAKGLLKLDDD